jgi:hypothetical protein
MKNNICILGQGRSFKRIKEFSDSISQIMLCNYDVPFIEKNILNDNELLQILKEKECILFCNTSKSGFNSLAFETFNVTRCVVNRVKPTENWELWKTHKSTQEKGTWFHNENIPPIEKDLPYFFKWRGPGPYDPTNNNLVPHQNVNFPEMFLSNGFKVEHLSEDIEMYLFEPTRDRLETNMGLYFTALHSIVDLKKTHLYYAGIDFYDKIDDGEAWKFLDVDRLRMEGEHMKILLNDYLARYFPKVLFEFYTHADFTSDKENVKINKG